MIPGQFANHDALLSDGRVVRIRSLAPQDRDALLALDAAASDRSIYLRFFSVNRSTADDYVGVLLRPASADHHALIAELHGCLVGVASSERVSADSAEVALLVADAHHHEGIGTLLLEHLAAAARDQGMTRFVADVLAENYLMLRTLSDLGFVRDSHVESAVVRVTLDIRPTVDMLRAMDERDRVSQVASLRPLLSPSSVVVVGAGIRQRSVGHQVLRNILAEGFTGEVYVVNPKHHEVMGLRSFPSATLLPYVPDLAIIAVPIAASVEAIADCGRRGIRAAVVLTAGFGELGPAGAAVQDLLLATTRAYGMRIVGPNCLGLVNTDPAIRLNATFAALPMAPGGFALVSQSGALGAAVAQAGQREGLGLAQFISIGNKVDVSSNDLLMAWSQDDRTKVIGLYLESFGNPAKFSRIARGVSRTKPIIAIKAGRSAAGGRAGQSHTAAAASDDAVVDALFRAAGVIRVDTIEEMLDAARVLCDRPIPVGPRVGIIGNSGGPGILAADAAAAAGLTIVELSSALQASIKAAAPNSASTQNPVDLGAAAQPPEVRAALRAMLQSDEVDAVLGVFTETLVADPAEIMAAVGSAVGTSAKPVVITQVGGDPATLLMEGVAQPLVVFGFPEPAARALAHSWRYGQIRSAPVPGAARLNRLQPALARQIVSTVLSTDGEWLDPVEVHGVLTNYGLDVCPQRLVDTAEQAVAAAHEFGFPVALKIGDLTVHKADVGGVQLDLKDATEVRSAFTALRRDPPGRVLVQPMVTGPAEFIVGGLQDAQFGPVVMVGAGGFLADLIGDRQFALAPLDGAEALAMVNGLKYARLLDGYRGQPPGSRAALSALIIRVGALVNDIPEIAEIDLNPVIGHGDRFIVVDAKIRVTHAPQKLEVAVRQLSAPSALQVP